MIFHATEAALLNAKENVFHCYIAAVVAIGWFIDFFTS